MPEPYEYIITSKCTSTSYDHYHSVALSDINNALRNNIPNYAWIYSAKVYLKMNHSSVLGTLGNADVNIWFCNNGDDNSGTKLLSGTTSVNPKEFPVDITSYVSNIYYPFTISCSSYSRLAVYYDSTTRRKYNCEVFKVVVEYRIPSYIIRVNATEGGTASCDINTGDYIQHGTQAVITATPNTGYKFVKWLEDGNTSATRTITVTSNATYTATFEKIRYTLTVSADTGGSVSGGGTYDYGTSVTLTATANACYEFVKWSDGNTSPSRTVTVTGAASYTAQFRINRILANKLRAKKLIIDLDTVKAILVDTTKVYG